MADNLHGTIDKAEGERTYAPEKFSLKKAEKMFIIQIRLDLRF